MEPYYFQIRNLHVAMVMASGLLFALRGTASLLGFGWPLSRPARAMSYVVDTTLFTAAMLLLWILPWGIFANGWLVTKLGLLVMYVVLGYVALRPGRSRKARGVLFGLAVLVYGWMFTIARGHHPLGVFHDLVLP